jgi:hypothetical protein
MNISNYVYRHIRKILMLLKKPKCRTNKNYLCHLIDKCNINKLYKLYNFIENITILVINGKLNTNYVYLKIPLQTSYQMIQASGIINNY